MAGAQERTNNNKSYEDNNGIWAYEDNEYDQDWSSLLFRG